MRDREKRVKLPQNSSQSVCKHINRGFALLVTDIDEINNLLHVHSHPKNSRFIVKTIKKCGAETAAHF